MLPFPWEQLEQLGLPAHCCPTCMSADWRLRGSTYDYSLSAQCMSCWRVYEMMTWSQHVAWLARQLADVMDTKRTDVTSSKAWTALVSVYHLDSPITGEYPRLVCTSEGRSQDDDDDDPPF